MFTPARRGVKGAYLDDGAQVSPWHQLAARFALQRPTEKQLSRFKIEDIGNDTVGDYIARSDSLVICCRGCQRLLEWIPADLKDRFPDPSERIAAIAGRLRCSAPEGCGSTAIAVFPHFNVTLGHAALHDGPPEGVG